MTEDHGAGALPVVPGTFGTVGGELTLIGGFCPRCGRHDFPRPSYCRTCLEPVEPRPVGGHGTVYSYTVVRTKAPLGLPEPYGIGYVDLEESGLRVFCLFDPEGLGALRLGLPVRLEARVLGHDGRGAARVRPYFTPAGREGRR
jgi:uncharacterized OB-fold protein